MDTQIQIQFPCSGEWGRINMTAVYQDAEGYIRTPQYTQDDIPPALVPAIITVISTWTAMDAPWRARMVIAAQGQTPGPDNDDGAPTVRDCVNLVVHAEDSSGGRKVFTSSDDPACTITDPAAVEFFRYFTGDQLNS